MSNSINLIELARQGDPKALSYLINQKINTRNVQAKVSFKNISLQILLESNTPIDKSIFVELISNGIRKLEISGITELSIYGKEMGEDVPSWSEKVVLLEEESPFQEPIQNLTTQSVTKSKIAIYTSIPRKSTKEKDIDLLDFPEHWKSWDINQKIIMVSTGTAFLSMFQRWFDLSELYGTKGLEDFPLLYLFLYIYPAWMNLKHKTINKNVSIACSVIAILLSLNFIITYQDTYGAGVLSFLVSSIALGVGSFRIKKQLPKE